MLNFRLMTLALALLCAGASAVAAKTDYPEITLDYKPLFDNACADATKQPLNAEAVKELQSRLGEFQEFWRKEAPRLLGTVPKVTGAPFRFREAKAARSSTVWRLIWESPSNARWMPTTQRSRRVSQ